VLVFDFLVVQKRLDLFNAGGHGIARWGERIYLPDSLEAQAIFRTNLESADLGPI
jgi:hypothetical protein